MFEMIRRVFKIAGNSRGKIVAGIVCNILKSFFNGFMMFGVFWILLHLDRRDCPHPIEDDPADKAPPSKCRSEPCNSYSIYTSDECGCTRSRFSLFPARLQVPLFSFPGMPSVLASPEE